MFPRKIAFVGTTCVGKTTLLEYYKKRFANNAHFAFLDEAARIFFTTTPDAVDRFSATTQEKVLDLALQREQTIDVAGVKILLCDRSVIDAAVYVRSYGDIEGSDRLLQKVSFWLPTYHTLLLLDPADIPYTTDAIRDEDHFHRQRFHNAFISLFTDKNIPYELVRGTLAQRIRRVDEILAGLTS